MAHALHPGAHVRVMGLRADTDLNGSEGVCRIWNPQSGRWTVRLGESERNLKPDNLEVVACLCLGAEVKIVGLVGAAHLNGSSGSCESWQPETGRWMVSLGGAVVKAVRPENLYLKRGAKRRRVAPCDLREVRLPKGWAGLSFGCGSDGRLMVTEVPKTCFSSANFGAAAASQVSDVAPGDEVVSINGEAPKRLLERIGTAGDELNTCGLAHRPGSVGKLDPSPCISCDALRRHNSLGLHVALQMWMRVVKADIPIVLGVATEAPGGAAKAARGSESVVQVSSAVTRPAGKKLAFAAELSC